MKKLFIKTYGCQMNVYDSAQMEGILSSVGYEITDDMPEADMVILNTCHIREKAAEKVYSELGRINQIKSSKLGNMIIVVAGCVGQAEGEEIFTRAPFVDIVVGPQSYNALPDLISKITRDKQKQLIELDFIEEAKFDLLPEHRLKNVHGTASISVQEGCDKFCTFCVVPYTRGAEFSRKVDQVYREISSAVAGGAKDIELLGQNVNAYHGLSPEGKIFSLSDLIKHISQIKGLERIRYTTSHPLDMTDELIALHGSEAKLMPFLHLPIQSGSDNILKAMNRKHTRNHYLEIIARLREARQDMVFSSDFIVGFPGETDQDFEDTLDLVRKVRYGQCYSFKYSPRPGTPAASKLQVPEHVKTQRLDILQKELARQQLEYNESIVGKVLPVMFMKDGKFDNQIIGKTPYMHSVHVSVHDKALLGQIVQVKILSALATSVAGEIVHQEIAA